LTAIKFSWEKTLELTVEFHCHQPKRFDKSYYRKDPKFLEQSFDSIAICIEVKNIFYL